MSLLPADVVDAMRASGPRVRARLSYLRGIMDPQGVQPPYPVGMLQPGTLVAKLGCPACTLLYAAADGDLAADWEAF